MQFRTEIATRFMPEHQITHSQRIVMLGSCFTDNVGTLLERDGFQVTHNPLGPLYNPASIANAISRALHGPDYTGADFKVDNAGLSHCLDFASKYTHQSAQVLADALNAELHSLGDALRQADTVIITLGTAFVYRWGDADGHIVGNCHKFPPQSFTRHMLSVEQASQCISHIREMLHGKELIFTVSPIRHIGDGLHANQLSKATLLLALESQGLPPHAYFPAYEIMLDDLRDYRFYAADMKHPSEVAIEYIYQAFADNYFSKQTQETARERQKAWRQSAHRPIEKL